jgi:hypothetical protein
LQWGIIPCSRFQSRCAVQVAAASRERRPRPSAFLPSRSPRQAPHTEQYNAGIRKIRTDIWAESITKRIGGQNRTRESKLREGGELQGREGAREEEEDARRDTRQYRGAAGPRSELLVASAHSRAQQSIRDPLLNALSGMDRPLRAHVLRRRGLMGSAQI